LATLSSKKEHIKHLYFSPLDVDGLISAGLAPNAGVLAGADHLARRVQPDSGRRQHVQDGRALEDHGAPGIQRLADVLAGVLPFQVGQVESALALVGAGGEVAAARSRPPGSETARAVVYRKMTLTSARRPHVLTDDDTVEPGVSSNWSGHLVVSKLNSSSSARWRLRSRSRLRSSSVWFSWTEAPLIVVVCASDDDLDHCLGLAGGARSRAKVGALVGLAHSADDILGHRGVLRARARFRSSKFLSGCHSHESISFAYSVAAPEEAPPSFSHRTLGLGSPLAAQVSLKGEPSTTISAPVAVGEGSSSTTGGRCTISSAPSSAVPAALEATHLNVLQVSNASCFSMKKSPVSARFASGDTLNSQGSSWH